MSKNLGKIFSLVTNWACRRERKKECEGSACGEMGADSVTVHSTARANLRGNIRKGKTCKVSK